MENLADINYFAQPRDKFTTPTVPKKVTFSSQRGSTVV